MEPEQFRLDRSAFHMGNHTTVASYHARMQPESFAGRLQAANYLISVAFQYDLRMPPKLDRDCFLARKHNG